MRRVGKGALRRAHHLIQLIVLNGGHASLCPPYALGTKRLVREFIHITQRWRMRIMGRYLLLWMLGIPLPILVLIYAFGGLH